MEFEYPNLSGNINAFLHIGWLFFSIHTLVFISVTNVPSDFSFLMENQNY